MTIRAGSDICKLMQTYANLCEPMRNLCGTMRAYLVLTAFPRLVWSCARVGRTVPSHAQFGQRVFSSTAVLFGQIHAEFGEF